MIELIKYADGNYYEFVKEIENKERKITQYYYRNISGTDMYLLLTEEQVKKYSKNI